MWQGAHPAVTPRLTSDRGVGNTETVRGLEVQIGAGEEHASIKPLDEAALTKRFEL